MKGCIFCEILRGKREASFVYRDELVSAFMDTQPINPGHILILPNEHASFLADINPETGGKIFQTGQLLASALRKSQLKCEGVNFFLADGEAAHQEIFHLHLHVFPRFRGDGFRIQVGNSYQDKPSRDILDDQAQAVIRGLERSAG